MTKIQILNSDDINFLTDLQGLIIKMIGGIVDINFDENKNLVITSIGVRNTLRWVFGFDGKQLQEICGRCKHLGLTVDYIDTISTILKKVKMIG